MPKLRSSSVVTESSETGVQNEGHPLPESYFSSERKSAVLHPAQR
jgi:hypothetical protein